MQIILKQRDIEQAVKAYIEAQGIKTAGKTIEIGFTAGRGSTGLTAEIELIDRQDALQPAASVLGKIAATEYVAEAPAADAPFDTEPETTAEVPSGTSLFA